MHPKKAVEFLLDLVAIPSISAMANRPVVEYAFASLDSARWSKRYFPYRDPEGIEKVCGLAMTGEQPELTLVCHTDTVPYEEGWHEAVAPAVREGRLYGRGSCDVKGFLACVLEAVAAGQPRRSLAVLLTADEEVGCVGARQMAREKAFSTRWMVIGEPTGMQPVHAGKGYGLGEIVVLGKEAHSAFPQRGRSAIRDAARVVEALDEVEAALREQGTALFDPPYTTLNIGRINGGTAKNIVPGECRMVVEWRPVAGQRGDLAATMIQATLAKLAQTVSGLQAELIVQRLDPPFEPGEKHGLVDTLERLTGRTRGTVAFGTEATHLSGLAEEVVVIGPGDMTTAHRTGEHVPVHALEECVDVLRQLIRERCS